MFIRAVLHSVAYNKLIRLLKSCSRHLKLSTTGFKDAVLSVMLQGQYFFYAQFLIFKDGARLNWVSSVGFVRC